MRKEFLFAALVATGLAAVPAADAESASRFAIWNPEFGGSVDQAESPRPA